MVVFEAVCHLGAQLGLSAYGPSVGHGLLVTWLLGSKREEDEAVRPVTGYPSSGTTSFFHILLFKQSQHPPKFKRVRK